MRSHPQPAGPGLLPAAVLALAVAVCCLGGTAIAGPADDASLVADINRGPAGSKTDVLVARALTRAGGTVFFTADDGTRGTELWATDGTPTGTRLVEDVLPGNASSAPEGLAAVGDTLYFSADDGTHGRELWRSDGTAAGTEMLVDLRSGASGADGSSSPVGITAVGSRFFFSARGDGPADRELWRSDGTAAGTVLVKDISPVPGGSSPSDLLDASGTLFFIADDGSTGRELWKSDGTETGTVLVKDIAAGTPAPSRRA